MRLLIDANLAPRVAAQLNRVGHDAVHVFELGMHTASDAQIVETALEDDRVIVSSDADFGALLAQRERSKPSFVLLRYAQMTPDEQADLLESNLPRLADDLEAGAVVVLSRGAIRVRRLPFGAE